MKYIVCYSGGHSSALVAIETVRKHGKENVILLNHDISSKVEHEDIKRFKRDVADYLDLDITYANADNFEEMTPLEVSIKKQAFQIGNGQSFCTSYLKTEPFHRWLAENHPGSFEVPEVNIKIAYGFDETERLRIQRRATIMAAKGYQTEFPLSTRGGRTIQSTEEIGIPRPITYRMFKHANCMGCMKAGKQHWYCTFCTRPDIWEEAKKAEEKIGYSIIKDAYLEELEPRFKEMKGDLKICPNDKTNSNTFWAAVNNALPDQMSMLPCECSI